MYQKYVDVHNSILFAMKKHVIQYAFDIRKGLIWLSAFYKDIIVWGFFDLQLTTFVDQTAFWRTTQ